MEEEEDGEGALMWLDGAVKESTTAGSTTNIGCPGSVTVCVCESADLGATSADKYHELMRANDDKVWALRANLHSAPLKGQIQT